MPKPLYVTRVKKPYLYWNLRFRMKGEVVFRESFSDKKYGGEKEALEAAITARDKIAKLFNVLIENSRIKDYRYTHEQKSTRNKTGVIGVALTKQGNCYYYRASISKTIRKESIKVFSCTKLGKAEAFRQAVKQRKNWEKELLEKKNESKQGE